MSEPVTPRPAATVMLLRDAADLEVLLLRRSGSTPFVPGAHVFPGGALEDDDRDPALTDHMGGLDDATASRTLGLDLGGRAFWVAAVREAFEEAGVLLAHDADGVAVDDRHPVLREHEKLRRELEAGDRTLASLCAEHELRLGLDSLVYVAQWITPAESPIRYDARFFAAAMPPGQTASPDDWEAVDAAWWRPTDALDSWQAGDIDLIEPTVVSLQTLAEHAHVAGALSELAVTA